MPVIPIKISNKKALVDLDLTPVDNSDKAVAIQSKIDTGATCTLVPFGTGKQLGIEPVSITKAKSATGAEFEMPTYFVDMVFTTAAIDNKKAKVTVQVQRVCERPKGMDYGLLGMDFLARGVLIVDGPNDTASFAT